MSVQILVGDAREVLKTLPSESVHMCVTSPPYYGLRDYGTGGWSGGDVEHEHDTRGARGGRGGSGAPGKQTPGAMVAEIANPVCSCGATRIDKQMGLEATPEEWVEGMVGVFREVRRVLRPDGVMFVNVGDSYAGSGKGPSGNLTQRAANVRVRGAADFEERAARLGYDAGSNFANYGERMAEPKVTPGCKPKDLIGIPWALAKALRDPYYAGRIKAERDRVWLAAIIDGEGSICGYDHIRKDDGSPRTGLNVTITNSSIRLLDEAARIWPASRHYHNAHGAGHLGLQPTYRWIAHGIADQSLLMRELYPYLITKKTQALLAYNLLELMAVSKQLGKTPQMQATRDKRSLLVHLMSRLNHGESVDVPSWCVEPASVLEDGWYLRADIIWSKPNPMPESVTDRPTKAHEYLFLLSKSRTYYYDADAIREEAEYGRRQWSDVNAVLQTEPGRSRGIEPLRGKSSVTGGDPSTGRNKRSVWTVATEAFPEAHFATYPTALVEPCIKAGTSERGCCPECGAPWVRVVETKYVKSPVHGNGSQMRGRAESTAVNGWAGMPRVARQDTTTGWRPSCRHNAEPVPATVLDPFGGAGTTALVADRLNRNAILIELNPGYAEMARRRIAGDSPMFSEVIVA